MISDQKISGFEYAFDTLTWFKYICSNSYLVFDSVGAFPLLVMYRREIRDWETLKFSSTVVWSTMPNTHPWRRTTIQSYADIHFNDVVSRPYCVDIITLYFQHLVKVLQCSLRCQYYVFLYFHSRLIALMFNEIYPVFYSDLCVCRCCVCIFVFKLFVLSQVVEKAT